MRIASLFVFLFSGLVATAQAPEPFLFCLAPRVQLGEVTKGSKVTHVFKLENRSRAPLNIKDVSASCDCTTAPLAAKTLAPGATLELPVTFDSAKFEGPVEKTITVSSEDPVRPVLVLELAATVVDRWTLSPAGVFFGHHSRFHPFEAKVRVTRKDGQEPVVRAATLQGLPVFDEVEVVRLPEQKAVELVLRAAPGAPLGLMKGKLSLVLGDPEQPFRELPVMGQFVDDLEAAPRVLELGQVPLGGSAPLPLRVTTFRHGLEIKGLSVEPAWLAVVLTQRKALDASAIRGYLVRFQVPKDAPIGPFKGVVKVRSNSADQSEVEVTVSGTVVEVRP